MKDHFTPLENRLDALYVRGRDQLALPGVVQSWDDFIQRRGYLTAISDVGKLIEEMRKPEGTPPETGEIFDILEPSEREGQPNG